MGSQKAQMAQIGRADVEQQAAVDGDEQHPLLESPATSTGAPGAQAGSSVSRRRVAGLLTGLLAVAAVTAVATGVHQTQGSASASGVVGSSSLLAPGKPQLVPSTQRVIEHLVQLEEIARAHGGSRSVATGHQASVDYVVQQLAPFNSSLKVWTEDVPLLAQIDSKPPVLRSFIRRKNSKKNDEFAEIEYTPRIDVAVQRGSGSATIKDAAVHRVSSCSSKLLARELVLFETSEDDKNDKDKKKKKHPKKEDWVALIGPGSSTGCTPCDRLVHAIDLGAKGAIVYATPGNQAGYPHAMPPSPGSCARNPVYTDKLAKIAIVALS
eukprot:jgi/Hompol1/5426/HPOL_004405-RA